MTTGTAVSFITDEPQPRVRTLAACEDTLATESPHRSVWQSVIDQKLIEWGRDPAQLAEEELIPPTRVAVYRAIQVARHYRDRDMAPPMRVVPDGDGGIVLERWEGAQSEALEIDRHGRVVHVVCVNRRVVARTAL